MGTAIAATPFTTRTLLIARLALCGVPFLAGFYSKDLILEATSARVTKCIGATLALIATFLTAAYSLRVVYFTRFYSPKNHPKIPIREEDLNLIFPLTRLLAGALVSGWVFCLSLFNFFPLLVPLVMKSLPLIVTVLATAMVLNYLIKTNLIPAKFFLSRKWYYVQIWHMSFFRKTTTRSLLGVLRSLDQGWAARLGAQGIISWTKTTSNISQKALSGIVIKYLLYSLFLFGIRITVLWVI